MVKELPKKGMRYFFIFNLKNHLDSSYVLVLCTYVNAIDLWATYRSMDQMTITSISPKYSVF